MFSAIWAASSRVGESTSMRHEADLRGCGSFARRWSDGSENAAVLPVPVWAMPRMSRPFSRAGIAWRWIGVGSE